jgi:predicted RNase H-like HicB family nuclease
MRTEQSNEQRVLDERHHLQVQIEPLAEGGYLAMCPKITGCHAEGATIGEAIDNLHSVTQVIYDLCRAKGLTFVADAPNVTLEQITWCIEVAPSLQVAA